MTLQKVEFEFEGVKSDVQDPEHFIHEYPGPCSLTFYAGSASGKSADFRVDGLAIRPLEYNEASFINSDLGDYTWYNEER